MNPTKTTKATRVARARLGANLPMATHLCGCCEGPALNKGARCADCSIGCKKVDGEWVQGPYCRLRVSTLAAVRHLSAADLDREEAARLERAGRGPSQIPIPVERPAGNVRTDF